jgi:Fe-S cluster assembly ATP-binding protein
MFLEINNLHVRIRDQDKQVLKGLDLSVPKGEVHAIMGPNGSGKSTLSNVLAGHPAYEVTAGTINFLGQDLLALAPEARAHLGIFLAFQYPVSLAGVANVYLLKAALNEKRKAEGLTELDAFDCLQTIKNNMKRLNIPENFLSRPVNEGFSGGEKKRNEMLQLLTLEPKLAILDETDSGLDIDALRAISEVVNELRSSERSFLMITHYQRLLDYIKPDVVHILSYGRILKSGGPELAKTLELEGYAPHVNAG